MEIEMMGDRILVKPLEDVDMTKSGIILVESARKKSQEGDVIAVGPGKISDYGIPITMNIKIGDRIIFTSYAGTDIKIGEDKFIIIQKDDVIARTKQGVDA